MDEAIAGIVASLRRARWTVGERDAARRIETIRRLRAAIVDGRQALRQAIAHDLGRPPAETDIVELQPLLLEIDHAIRHLPRWMAAAARPTPWLLFGTRAEIRCEPRGVVLILAPWNYPVNLTLAPLVAAVAAGNCVLLKPSEKTPETAAAIAALVGRVFDPAEVACVTGGPDVAEHLLTLPFDHVFFIGDGRKARGVLRAAAEHLAGTTIEAGSKSPAIVHDDADLEAAARHVVWGKCINAGQTCIAPDYVLVHERRADDFVRHAAAAVRRLYPPDAGGPPRDLCRLVDDAAQARITALVAAAVRGGARVAAGGEVWPDERRIAPTILTDVPAGSPLLDEEIFGPVLPVVPYASIDEAIDAVRGRPAPLAIYVFSRRRQIFERVVRRTAAGGSVWNQVAIHFGNPYVPFGGRLGAYHGWFGFRTFSQERAILRQGRISPMRWFHPPYDARLGRRLEWLRRLTGG